MGAIKLTYLDENANQHLQYIANGESFIDQRATGHDIRYKFTGKERDSETGFDYFGARYYDSDLSVWLSVDPMSDARPWVSSYNYCQNNPVMLIDPTGMLDGWYKGEDGKAAYNKDVHKQADMDAMGISGTYLFEEGYDNSDGTNKRLSADGKSTIVNYNNQVSAQKGDGFLDNEEVTKKQIKKIERNLRKQTWGAVVLHRTAISTSSSVFSTYENGKNGTHYGAHFLIDTDGTIYQTASLQYYCLHVGKTKKKSDPNNLNSLGIEVVGAYNKETKTWDPLTSRQIESTAWLVNHLVKGLGLNSGDIHIHENISAKTAGEGGTVYNAIKSKLR